MTTCEQACALFNQNIAPNCTFVSEKLLVTGEPIRNVKIKLCCDLEENYLMENNF